MNLLDALMTATINGNTPCLIIKPLTGEYEYCNKPTCHRELGHVGPHSRT